MAESVQNRKELLERLQAVIRLEAPDSGVKDWQEGDAKQAIQLIRELAGCEAARAIAQLLPFLVIGNEEIKAESAAAIARLFKQVTSAGFIRIDESLRSAASGRTYRQSWDNEPRLMEVLSSIQPEVLILGLASMHTSGYVRQQAVNKLMEFETGLELPFLLLRTTDWVRQVRSSAEHAISTRFKLDYARHFLANIALIDRLKQRKRVSAAILDAARANALKASTAEFISELENAGSKARRLCLYLGLNRVDNLDIIRRSLKNSDPLVRQIALLAAVAQLTAEQEKLELLEEALRDPHSCNRREALRICIQQFPSRSEALVYRALLDKSASVRLLARHHWKEKHDEFDPAAYYRRAINEAGSEALKIAALKGLAETGTAADFDLIQPILSSVNLRVRKTALNALVSLNKERAVILLLKSLSDGDDTLSAAALKDLQYCKEHLSGEELWQVYCLRARAGHIGTCVKLLGIFSSLPKWEQLGYLMLAVCGNSPELNSAALNYLKKWQNRFRADWRFSRPDKLQAERLRLVAPHIESKLRDLKYRELQLVLEAVLNNFM